MSVINQMLKELDQRKAPPRAGAEAGMPTGYVIRESNSRYIFILLGIIAILLLAIIYYFNLPANNNIAVKQGQPDKETTPSLLTVVEPAEAEQPTVSEAIKNPGELSREIIKTQINAPVLMASDIETNDVITAESTPVIQQDELETASQPITVEQKIVKSKVKPDPVKQAERLYRVARQKIEVGEITAAVELLNKALINSMDLHKARILLFSLLLRQQQITSLQSQLDDSLLRWPAVHEYRQLKARLLSQNANNELALDLLGSDIPLVSVAPEYHGLLAYVAQQAKKDAVAVKHYRILLAHNSARPDWWLGLAVSEERSGNPKAALQAYKQAVGRPGLTQSVQIYARNRIKSLQGF